VTGAGDVRDTAPDVPGTSRKTEVVNRVREEILSGRLRPGEPIRDAALAGQFGVSITPVREAVTQLIGEGLVTSLPNKRRQVTVLTPAAAAQLMDTLGVLLAAALRRAAPRCGPAECERLAVSAAELKRAGSARDGAAARQAVRAFIDQLMRLSGNLELAALIDTTAVRSYRLIDLTPGSGLWAIWTDGLNEVTTTLTGGRPVAATARLERMFTEVVDEIATHGKRSIVLDMTSND